MSADATERPAFEELTLENLGARTMTPPALATLAEHLRDLARYVEELRFLQLEHERNWREWIPNRPTIDYYLRLQKEKSA